jgi:hypothetical protein
MKCAGQARYTWLSTGKQTKKNLTFERSFGQILRIAGRISGGYQGKHEISLLIEIITISN